MFGSRWEIAFDFDSAIILFPFQISAEYVMPSKKRKKIKGTKKEKTKNYIILFVSYISISV